ncbi:protein disulfide-isomerase A6 [Hydra vulgaris]|uniref:protein disulfide-isomerase n=1 Tax=Hydra vulgaris TaxID=6087 RepID=T2MCY2_HYDVU|nr:protein disulfide-isomerase A6 [Hydra vulgaris]
MFKYLGVGLAIIYVVNALYEKSDDVVELTGGNFDHLVKYSDEIWLVEFYAPWCGHCKNLAPDWKKAATALKGIVKVGAVDMDVHGSVGGPYNVRGFPTIKIFSGDKSKPQDYNGARSAQAIVDEALKVASALARERLNGGSKRSSSGSGKSGNAKDVITLTDDNFEKEVIDTKDIVFVEFFAPWCGHCQRLEPEWAKAATELKGKVKLAALDATQYPNTAGRFNVQGYPTIKYFPAGAKDFNSAEDYQGGRTASDIIAFALDLHSANVDPPEIQQLTSDSVLKDNCNEKPLCVISFLPDILDTQAAGRNAYLDLLRELGEKYKKKLWGWVWTSAGVHPKLEKTLEVGGFGYPAMAVVNIKKKIFVLLRSGFGREGIDELLKGIAVGRGRTQKLEDGLPTLSDAPAWDGKDGELPVEEEDIDLSDVVLDDEPEKKTEL